MSKFQYISLPKDFFILANSADSDDTKCFNRQQNRCALRVKNAYGQKHNLGTRQTDEQTDRPTFKGLTGKNV